LAERLEIDTWERRQIKVDDPGIRPITEGGRVARQDEEITGACGGDIPEPDPLAGEFRYVPILDIPRSRDNPKILG